MTDAFSKYTKMVCIESKFANVVARAFLERWKRYAKIVKMIRPLNVQVLDENDRKKPYIIHINRVVMATSQQIREDCDSILSPYEDYIQTGVAHGEPREKDRKVDKFDEEQFGPYKCTASSQPGQQQPGQQPGQQQPGQQIGQQQKRRHVGTIPKQRSQGQITQQILQHETCVRPSEIEARGERDKCPTSAAASASQELGPSTPKQKKGVRWQQEEAEYEAEQEQFLLTEQREEDSDFYGFDEEEEENAATDELNAGFSQPPLMAAWVTDFTHGYFPGAAKKADNMRGEQAREQAREKEHQRARFEKEMQEDFCVHNKKNLAAQKTQQQQQQEKKKQQTPTRVSARIRGQKVPEKRDNKVEIPRLIPERKKKS
jgi:hypothetical protein